MRYKSFILLILILLFAQTAWTQTDLSILNTQGFLRDPITGGSLPNDTYQLTFRLYTQETGGTAFWTEVHDSVTIINSMFSVDLGTITSLSGVDFDGQYWLGISVNTDPELSPRMKLATAPYAITMIGTDNRFPASGDVIIGGGNLKITSAGKGVQFADSTRLESANIRISSLAADGGNPNNVVYVADDGKVGIGTDFPEKKLHVVGDMQINGTLDAIGSYDLETYDEINVNGNFKIGGNKPVQLKKYILTTNNSHATHLITTDFLFDEWIAIIAGFDAGYGDLEENGSGYLLGVQMKKYTLGNDYWQIVTHIRTEGSSGDTEQATWVIDVMFIKRNMAQNPINY